MNAPYEPHAAAHPTAKQLAQEGFAILSAAQSLALLGSCGIDAASLEAFAATWSDLPRDEYLADGGRYRYRRHASALLEAPLSAEPRLLEVPYRPHWQPKAYNKLHGGMFRHFPEIKPETRRLPAYQGILQTFGTLLALSQAQRDEAPTRWYIEAHQFRIDARQGEGRPTPEGAHRDGVDYVLLLMLGRRDIAGAMTSIYDRDGKTLCEFTLAEPWSAMLLDDGRVIHGTTPFQATGPCPERDTFVVTYRRDGFLEP